MDAEPLGIGHRGASLGQHAKGRIAGRLTAGAQDVQSTSTRPGLSLADRRLRVAPIQCTAIRFRYLKRYATDGEITSGTVIQIETVQVVTMLLCPAPKRGRNTTTQLIVGKI